MGLVEGSGICIATSSSGVNSPVTVSPMPSRQRSVERPQTCASSPRRDAVTRTSESNGKRGLRRCSGWRPLALEPNMAIAGRDYVPDYITPIRLGMVANYGRGNVISADRTPEISPCSKSSYFQMQPESWLSHSPPGITYGSPPVLNRLSADRGPRLALLIIVNLRQTFEEGSCFRFQSEKAQSRQDSRDSQMIVISRRKPDSRLGRKIASPSDLDLFGKIDLQPIELHHAQKRDSQVLVQLGSLSKLLH